MTAWDLLAGVAVYVVALTAADFLLSLCPLRPRRWWRRRRIAQHLCDRVEFLGLDPLIAWEQYKREVGGLSALWHREHERVCAAIQAACVRNHCRNVVGCGLDVVSEVPARLVLSDPQHTMRAV